MFHQDFRGYSFLAADLRGAHMAASHFEGRDFRGADLTRAGLSSSNLRNRDFEGANLEGADLSRADLTNTNLLFANLGNKRERAKLDGVKGLTDYNLGVLETRMDEIMEHVRIPNFHESRRYALHLRSSVAEVRKTFDTRA